MSSRDKILAAIAQNQPDEVDLPDISQFEQAATGSLQKFTEVLTGIGGEVSYVGSFAEIGSIIAARYDASSKIVTPIADLNTFFNEDNLNVSVHDLQDVELAILRGSFGVAENGAVWITEDAMGQRALPFISQHLAVIIDAEAIVATMHEAYQRINQTNYGFGTFIAGPSKTADIEQSLVIGAHGPKSMTVFVLENLTQ
jgi:L-lactate dehydrogenase complex protein LldG